MTHQHMFKLALLPLTFALLTGCGDDDDDNEMPPVVQPPATVNFSYEVSVTNLTHAQPFSPLFVAVHTEGQLWELGMSASEPLEQLAEAGDVTALAGQTMWLGTTTGSGILMPGAMESISVTVENTMPTMLSFATMLVNTNDAFTGISGYDLSSLAVGDSVTMTLGTYDAGTEQNSEMSGTIPGPADGGEGFNAARDDVDFVSMHSGVVTMDDGLATSILTQAHRFDNPTAKITITRME